MWVGKKLEPLGGWFILIVQIYGQRFGRHAHRVGSVTQELGYGLGKTLTIRGTEVSQLRTHTIQAYRAFDALMSVSTRALVIMQQLMKLSGGGQDHTES